MLQPPQTFTRVGDFDPAEFTIYACCGQCGHNAPLYRERVNQD